MYAIETYFIGPTDSRGSRIVARVMERGSGWAGPHKARKLTLDWNHALNPAANHKAAACALANKLGWHGCWVEGGSDDGASVWVNLSVGADTFGRDRPALSHLRLDRAAVAAAVSALQESGLLTPEAEQREGVLLGLVEELAHLLSPNAAAD